MGNDRSRQALSPDVAIAYGLTVICCQFQSDEHTRDIMETLPMLLDRASDRPAFAGIRAAAQRLIDARRRDLSTGGQEFFAARIDERRAVELFAWQRFCELYDEARAATPKHAQRDAMGKTASGEID